MPAGHSNSIVSRNRKAAKDHEALLWRALCDEADTAVEYMEPDCVIMNPLVHPDRSFEALTAESSPTLSEALEKLAQSKHRWTSCHMHKHNPELAIAQVEMMSVQIMYKVTLIREGHHHHHSHSHSYHGDGQEDTQNEEEGGDGRGLEKVDAFCASTWRQGAGGDWKLCAQQVIPV